MKCQKCGAEAVVTHQRRRGANFRPYTDANGTTHSPTVDDILDAHSVRIFDEEFECVFSCDTHGEFGLKPDGTPEFLEPDTWVDGPNGEKLFRM